MIDLSYKDIFGNLRDKQETANCYVISVPGDYCFPLIYGCGIIDGKDNKNSYTNQGEEKQADFYDYQNKIIKSPEINYKGEKTGIISWDNSRELIKDIRIVKDYIYLSISSIPENGGNYVLALFDNSGCVIWSWHIWLWGEKLENIDIGKHKLLNTNLASKYDSFGKLWNWYYQWGRKDPLCYLDKMVKIKEIANCIGQAIQNPRTFFTYNYNYNNNWVKKNGFFYIYNYWNSRCYKECIEEPVDKTIYDPCPPGYTVPGYGVFSELKKDKWDDKKKGWMFKGNIFFPASGYRYDDSGVLDGVDAVGFYWSTGANEGYASQLYFDNSSVYPLDSYDRAYGFSVRPCAIK